MHISFLSLIRYMAKKQRIKHKIKIENYLYCLLRRRHSDSRHTQLCTHSNSKGKSGKDIRMPLIHNRHTVQRNHRVDPDIRTRIHNRSHKAEQIHSHNPVGIHSSKVVHRCKDIRG